LAICSNRQKKRTFTYGLFSSQQMIVGFDIALIVPRVWLRGLYLLCLAILLASSLACGQASKHGKSWLEQGVRYEEKREWLSALHCYQEVLQKEPDHYEATWRAAVAASQSGYLYKDQYKKKVHLEKAMAYANRAMVLQPGVYTSHYASVMTIGAMMGLAGSNIPRMLEIGRQVKAHLDTTLALNPTHAESLAIMASMQIRLGSLNYFERVVAGDLARNMSIEKGLVYSRKALALKPEEVRFYMLAAQANQKLNKKGDARLLLQKAVQLQPRHADDEKWQQKCKEMLVELGSE
jgi:tetratricopeptide (TPR) repeat protein